MLSFNCDYTIHITLTVKLTLKTKENLSEHWCRQCCLLLVTEYYQMSVRGIELNKNCHVKVWKVPGCESVFMCCMEMVSLTLGSSHFPSKLMPQLRTSNLYTWMMS